MPDFVFNSVSSSLEPRRVHVYLFFQLLFSTFFCIMYVTQTPQTTDSTRAVQGACYNQLATMLYTPAACQQSRKQHHTRAVVCSRCITAVASYLTFLLLSNPAICSRPAGLCCCVMHAATGTTTQMFRIVVILYHMRMIPFACCMFSICSCATPLGTSRRGNV